MVLVKTIDAHAAGEPLRLIVDGFPSPRGKTMLEKREWVRKHADHLRRALMLEPRGHADMYGAMLTEPVSTGSQAGMLFMHNEGYSTMCGHGVIAVTTIAIERGLFAARERTDGELQPEMPTGRSERPPAGAAARARAAADCDRYQDRAPGLVIDDSASARAGAARVVRRDLHRAST